MTRPPRWDQRPPAETAGLVAELRAAVAAAGRLAASTVLAGPDRRRQVRVLSDGARTRLTHVEHGQVLAERDVDTLRLIDHLRREGQTYAVLTRLLTDPRP